ncbi:hypothetical protein MRX96_048921 [Rhipicephalus microplus]
MVEEPCCQTAFSKEISQKASSRISSSVSPHITFVIERDSKAAQIFGRLLQSCETWTASLPSTLLWGLLVHSLR